jgi:hypothetical protein
MAIMVMAPLVLATATLAPADAAAVNATVSAIYRPYRTADNPTAAWDYPIWSDSVAALITEWKSVMPEGEVDDLNDGDWLCLCQDWDAAKFRATVTSVRPQAAGVALAAVRIDLGFGQARSARLVLRRERGQWRIDDLFSQDFPRGLKVALRQTIAADRKLRR